MSLPGVLYLLPALCLLGAPLFAEEGVRGFLPPEACKPCHPQHYEEWSGSMHAYAITDPVFHAMNLLGQKETRGELGDFCIRCHAPVGTRTGEVTPQIRGVEGLSRTAAAGVSCQVCHQGVQLGPGHPANVSFDFAPEGPMLGGIADPVPTAFHDSKATDILKNPDFCGSCHNVVNQRGVPVEKPHVEYRESIYPERGIRCIDCHMQTYSGRATPDGPVRAQLHRHDFVGVDTALTPFPRSEWQRREVERFLRTAARMWVEAPEKVERGRPVEFFVHVKNAGAGHNLPTGPSTERQMWIEVTARRAGGEVIFRSGDLDASGDLRDHHSLHDPGGDRQLTLFTDKFVDDKGREVPFMWQAHRLVEGTIPPLETRTARYIFTPPPDASEISVEVRLRFRAFPPHQLRKLGIEYLRDRFPIFDMAEEIFSVAIVDKTKRPRTIRVPEDTSDLTEAARRAVHGGEILIAPGIHILRETLEISGKTLTLRSRGGSEDTVLEWVRSDPAELSPHASILLLQDGAQVRLEGLILRGGRGCELDSGFRVGGAVATLGSALSIADCRFEGNEADAGGAVYGVESTLEMLETAFAGNRAERYGGALAAVDSQLTVEGGVFTSNSAPDGGAVATVEAELLLARSRLQANWAFRGGALFVQQPIAAIVEEGFLLGNSAEQGGALYAEGGDVKVQRTVVAGNLGGGFHLKAARLFAERVTVADNRLGGGAVRSEGEVQARFHNSILWNNRPREVEAVVEWSLVDDDRHAGVSGNIGGFPLFWNAQSRWVRCASAEEEGCVPVVRGELRPQSKHKYRRYVPGDYRLLLRSPCVDAGDPRSPPDPDGTRADLGAYHRPQPRRLFRRGDLDGDGRAGLGDLLELWRALAAGDVLRCASAADIDGDSRLTPLDALRLALSIFGLLPPLPGDCGPDPTPDPDLGCFESLCSP